VVSGELSETMSWIIGKLHIVKPRNMLIKLFP